MTSLPRPPDPARPGADVLFYTDILRTFRSTLIGYLYQVCQSRRVVLLHETLDPETEQLLANTALFPGLVGRVPVNQYGSSPEPGPNRHRRLAALARQLVMTWRPKVVFAAGVAVFEHYLRRQAKEIAGAKTVGCMGLLLVRNPREVPLLLDLHAAETRLPRWLPRDLRRSVVRVRRRLAQAYEYWVLPMLAGQRPFPGVNGVYRLDYTRLQGMDAAIAFTRDNQAMMLRAGVPAGRVCVIPHPLKPGCADPVWRAYGMERKTVRDLPRVVTCFLDIEPSWGFLARNGMPIADEQLIASRIRVLEVLLDILDGWEIRIKPHPMSAASPLYARVMNRIRGLSPRIVWLPPEDPADRHVGQSGAIIGFPPASTAIYTAMLQNPGLPALQVDINLELRGDAYLGTPGVVTVSGMDRLQACLQELRAGHWSAGAYRHDEGDYETLDALLAAL